MLSVSHPIKHAPVVRTVEEWNTLPSLARVNADLRAVALMLLRAGCTVQPVLRDSLLYSHGFVRQFLIVNGKPCMILVARTEVYPSEANLHGYTQFELPLRRLRLCSAVLFYQRVTGHPERLFVVPTNNLIAKFREGQVRRTVHLPLVFKKSTNPSQWWQYENAWHLL